MKTFTLMLLSGIIVWQVSLLHNMFVPFPKPIIVVQEDPVKQVLKALGCPITKLDDITQAVKVASSQTRINPYLISVLMCTESSFNEKAISDKHYKGIMQTPTATFKYYDVDILHGARILQEKLRISKGNLLEAVSLYKGGSNQLATCQARKTLVLYYKIVGKING